MKKISLIFIAFAVMLCSCSTQKIVETTKRITLNYYFDFSEYSKQGFLIYPENCPTTYKPLGNLIVEVYPSTNVVKTPAQTIYDSARNIYLDIEEKILSVHLNEEITAEEMLSIFVEEAKKKGANGITYFKYAKINTSSDVYYCQISGYLIEY